MATVMFRDADGNYVPVSVDNPLPVSGAGGSGGLETTDILAAAPATVADNGDGTVTVGVSTGTGSTQAAKGNHTHSYASLTSKPVADFVDPSTGTVADVVNALIAAGLMASA